MNRWIGAAIAAIVTFLAPAANAAERATPALLVGSNSGTAIGRPDLHYADDDAARFYEVFRTLSAENDVAVVTRFDRDSQRLHPSLRDKAQPPTKANVRARAAILAQRAADLRASGVDVDFYFVFAGHGDVERGQGFLQLEDGPFTSSDLEILLKSIPATRSHVILDSCNSFFVVSARKPGGQHFASADDAARDLSRRLPNVGVFVSTSAEGEVFEWSEFGAGIFSHAVRSGLSGAADADGNGIITCAELQAFVNVATAEVKNPRYRPHVFARAPGGRRDETFFEPSRAVGRRVSLDKDRDVRITLRDADDIPWVDVHKETGAAMTLSLPAPLDRPGAVAEEIAIDAAGPRVVQRRRLTEDDDNRQSPISLTSLPISAASGSARGPSALFRTLFVRPFGPLAFAEQERDRAQDEPVYGVSGREVERFGVLLEQVAENQRTRRLVGGAAAAAGGAVALGAGVVTLAASSPSDDLARAFGFTYGTVGATMLLTGGAIALLPSGGEKLHEEFRLALTRPGANRAVVFATMEGKLKELARDERKQRHFQLVLGSILTVAAGTLFVLNETAFSSPMLDVRITSAVAGALGATLTVSSLAPSPVERLAGVWAASSDQPPKPVARLGVAPLPGGGLVGLGGMF